MKKRRRLVVETSRENKSTLDYILAQSGATFSEWLNARIEEAAAPYSARMQQLFPEITSLSDLEDPKKVAAKLRSIDWAFTEADTSYLSHDIHPYPSKFIPQIPAHLITQLSLRGELVWDPFGGSGTTALEAVLLSRRCISSDVNPLCEIIGKAKTITLTREEEAELLDLRERLLLLSDQNSLFATTFSNDQQSKQHLIPDIPSIEKWFGSDVVRDLSYLREQIESLQSESSKTVAEVAFSRTVMKVSNQDGETRYACKPKQIQRGFTFRCFAGDLDLVLSKVRLLGALLRFRKASFLTLDTRDKTVTEARTLGSNPPVAPNSVDLIVTSPPYPNANDYHLYHRFRLFWLGYDPRKLARTEIGSHLRHQKERSGFDAYIEDMKPCLENCFVALRPGRYAAFVVGDALFERKLFHTADWLRSLGSEVGFEFVASIDRPVHATKRSFIGPARRTRSETILVIRKPAEKIIMKLLEPPYKLWGYEKILFMKEINRLTGTNPKPKRVGKREFELQLSCYEVDRLRRLTFAHGLVSKNTLPLPTWQAVLENGDALAKSSRRKDPKYSTHGIHPYKGKFYPQLAKSLLNLAGVQSGEAVLDPFCGSGTVLLEGYLNGVRAYGCDLNPLAVKIAQAKTDILDVDLFIADRIFARFLERLRNGSAEDKWLSHFRDECKEEIKRWFAKPVANKLGWLLSEIDQLPDPRIQAFLQVLVSSIIRRISQQDPSDLRIRRRKQLLEDAPVFEIFCHALTEQRRRLLDFAARAQWSPHPFHKAMAWLGDSRHSENFSTAGIKPESVAAVITSPPYATALPYIDTDRLSILTVLGMPSVKRGPIEEHLTGSREIAKSDREKIDHLIESNHFEDIPSPLARKLITSVYKLNTQATVGFRRKNMAALLYRYFADMTAVLNVLLPLVRRRGRAFFVVGDNKTRAGDQDVCISTTAILAETSQILGWKVLEKIPITVTTENLKHIQHAITTNTILCLER